MSQEQWYLLDGEDRVGPLTTTQLKERAGSGELRPADLVWKYGLDDWTPAQDFEYLFPAGGPPPTTMERPRTEPAPDPQPAAAEAPNADSDAPRLLASPALRIAAACIDLALLAVPASIIASICMSAITDFNVFLEEREGQIKLLSTVLLWTYFATQECGPRQGTFGKRILGLKVTDLAGQPITFARASARHFARALLPVGFLLALFSERRQALHDSITGCVVVHEQDPS